jgi:CO/xanthine dehydrogenase Mo-binding subunit
MNERKQIGEAIPRLDSVEKVTGLGTFAADVRLPGMLVGKFLVSPHPHAEILGIDTSKAEKLPGVHAVVTGSDISDEVQYNPASRFHAFLARQYVVFAGQPVAAVAADDLATAETALDLIEVSYRSLPIVASLEQAIEPGCIPVLHGQPIKEQVGSAHTQGVIIDDGEEVVDQENESPNIADETSFTYGDLETAFADSAVVIENTYTVPTVHQGYIEPHGVTAYWDKPDHVIVWECVQGVFAAREIIADGLGIPPTKITLNATDVGGGFGGKGEGIFGPIAVLLAKEARRPVQLILTREEELIGANPAPHSIIRVKTGAKEDGTFTAIEAEILVDAGAFPTGWIMANITATLRDNYRFEAWHVHGREVLTNKASVSSYRAPGAPNAHFAMESQVDEIALALRLDPLKVRLKNVIREGDLLTGKSSQDPVGSQEVLQAVAEHKAWLEPMSDVSSDLLHGHGMSFGSWAGSNGPAGAVVYLESGGKFRFVVGTVDLTGSYTGLTQIAAEALGVSVDKIVMTKASPDHAPFAPMSAGSQTIYAMGAAVLEAACDIRSKLLTHVARDFGSYEADLAVDDDGIYLITQPDRKLTFSTLYELGTEWFAEFGPVIGVGSATQRKRAPGFAACVAEVSIEPRTGKISLTKLTMFQDVGRAINPLLIEGQMQGAAAQSAAMALWEELVFDDAGQVSNRSLLDYRMPTAADMPPIDTVIVESPGGDGPFGAKLVGEPPMTVAVTAVANAVANAIGKRVCDLPITPERVWRAIS